MEPNTPPLPHPCHALTTTTPAVAHAGPPPRTFRGSFGPYSATQAGEPSNSGPSNTRHGVGIERWPTTRPTSTAPTTVACSQADRLFLFTAAFGVTRSSWASSFQIPRLPPPSLPRAPPPTPRPPHHGSKHVTDIARDS